MMSCEHGIVGPCLGCERVRRCDAEARIADLRAQLAEARAVIEAMQRFRDRPFPSTHSDWDEMYRRARAWLAANRGRNDR